MRRQRFMSAAHLPAKRRRALCDAVAHACLCTACVFLLSCEQAHHDSLRHHLPVTARLQHHLPAPGPGALCILLKWSLDQPTPLPTCSYNNIICDAGIKKDGGEGSSGAGAGSGSGGSTPSPTPASNGEGSQGGEEGLDWEKLLDAKPSICDPLPAELTTCGTGVSWLASP